MENYTVYIRGIGSEMQGIGNLPDGRCVFVPGTVPGETAEIAIEKEAARYAVGRLVSVIDRSAQRAEPFCPLYGQCGGCTCQHMDYNETLENKRQIVADAIERIGGIYGINVEPTLASDRTFAYRNKVEFAVDRNMRLGFAKQNSHSIVPAADCPLSENNIALTAGYIDSILYKAGAELSYVTVRQNYLGECMLILSGSRPGKLKVFLEGIPECVKSIEFCRLKFRPSHALDGPFEHLWGDSHFTERVNDDLYSLSAPSFFQINRTQAEKMLNIVSNAAETSRGIAADIYCGVGTFAHALAHTGMFEKVYGFEVIEPAVENARKNAEYNGFSSVTEFHAGDAAVTMPKVLRGKPLSFAVIDPPRKGAAPEVLQALIDCNTERIAYVSCNPATLARDLKILTSAYKVEKVQPVDMFPWTGHVESVVLMSRKKE